MARIIGQANWSAPGVAIRELTTLLARVGVHDALRDDGLSVFLQQMARAAARPVGEILVHPPDVAVARLGREAELRRGALRRLPP